MKDSDFGWHFKAIVPGHRMRDPLQGEQLKTDSFVEPILKEGPQNSADVWLEKSKPAVIKITISGDEWAVPADDAKHWMSGKDIRKHLKEAKNITSAPDLDKPMQFLLFEDFNTKGLTGNYETNDDSSNFSCFLRMENITNKTTSDGSWGVGKAAFPNASRINGFFVLTRRSDDSRCLLMGSMTLSHRKVGGVEWSNDAWFGFPQEGAQDGGFIQPSDNERHIKRFSKNFKADNRSSKSGTSIVVPYPKEDLMSLKGVVDAAITHNLYRIVAGILTFEISSPDCASLKIDSKNVVQVAEEYECGPDVIIMGKLLKARHDRTDNLLYHLGDFDSDFKSMRFESLDHEDRAKKEFESGRELTLTFNVKHKGFTDSKICVHLKRIDEAKRVPPFFARGGILVHDKYIKKLPPGVAAFCSCQEGVLHDVLMNAEDPGHIGWNPTTQNIEEMIDKTSLNKKQIADLLALARKTAQQAVRFVTHENNQKDEFILASFFSTKSSGSSKSKSSGAGGKKSGDNPPFDITKVTKPSVGLRVSSPRRNPPEAAQLTIHYKSITDKRATRQDFDLERGDLEISKSGCTVLVTSHDTLLIENITSEFELKILGFDPIRDLGALIQERQQ